MEDPQDYHAGAPARLTRGGRASLRRASRAAAAREGGGSGGVGEGTPRGCGRPRGRVSVELKRGGGGPAFFHSGVLPGALTRSPRAGGVGGTLRVSRPDLPPRGVSGRRPLLGLGQQL